MHFRSGRNTEIGVCALNGTNLKVMVYNKIQVKRNSFINIFRELLDRTTEQNVKLSLSLIITSWSYTGVALELGNTAFLDYVYRPEF
jgi:hypothetical protein